MDQPFLRYDVNAPLLSAHELLATSVVDDQMRAHISAHVAHVDASMLLYKSPDLLTLAEGVP